MNIYYLVLLGKVRVEEFCVKSCKDLMKGSKSQVHCFAMEIISGAKNMGN